MKFLIIFICLFPIYLFSSQKIVDINDDYTKGLKYYKINDFENSYKFFHKIYFQKLMDQKFNFYFGKSAYETKHYEMALSAFERVEIINPNNFRVKLEIGRIYFILGMYEDSQLKFIEVLKYKNTPKNVKNNAKLYLSKIKDSIKKSSTNINIGFDLFYDSNINYGSLSDTYNIGENILPTPDRISDTGLQFSANVINLYDIGIKNNFLFKNKISIFTKMYNKNHLYNINYVTYNPSLIFISKQYTAEIEVGLDNLFIDNKKYMQSILFKPQLEINHSNSLKSLISLKITDKLYDEKSLDSYQYELAYSLQEIIGTTSYLINEIVYLTQEKKEGDRIDVNYNEYKFDITYLKQLKKNYKFNLYSEIKKRNYDRYSELFLSTRSDILTTISTGLSIELFKNLDFNIKAIYNYNNSNQKIFSYKKTTISTSIVKIF